ncbi:MAG: hypothetical protein ACR2O5_10210, partial [Thiogranum sp.]
LPKKLMALWLTVALVIAPLQTVTAGSTGDGNDAEHCAMNTVSEADSRSGAHDMHQDNQDPAASHCPACSDQTCNQGGECSSQGCVIVHLQPAAISAMHLQHITNSDRAITLQLTRILSRTDPPLLRPPV